MTFAWRLFDLTHGATRQCTDAGADQRTLAPVHGVIARCQAHGDSRGSADQRALGRLAGFTFARIRVHGLATRQQRHDGHRREPYSPMHGLRVHHNSAWRI